MVDSAMEHLFIKQNIGEIHDETFNFEHGVVLIT